MIELPKYWMRRQAEAEATSKVRSKFDRSQKTKS